MVGCCLVISCCLEGNNSVAPVTGQRSRAARIPESICAKTKRVMGLSRIRRPGCAITREDVRGLLDALGAIGSQYHANLDLVSIDCPAPQCDTCQVIRNEFPNLNR